MKWFKRPEKWKVPLSADQVSRMLPHRGIDWKIQARPDFETTGEINVVIEGYDSTGELTKDLGECLSGTAWKPETERTKFEGDNPTFFQRDFDGRTFYVGGGGEVVNAEDSLGVWSGAAFSVESRGWILTVDDALERAVIKNMVLIDFYNCLRDKWPSKNLRVGMQPAVPGLALDALFDVNDPSTWSRSTQLFAVLAGLASLAVVAQAVHAIFFATCCGCP